MTAMPAIIRRVMRMVTLPLLAAALLGLPTAASAEDFPARPVRFIVPFPAGGPLDALARLLGQKLGESWKQPVVVENRPGAGGNIGIDLVARGPADGYTLLWVPAGNLTTSPSLYPKLPYDPLRDFAPITIVAATPNLLVVNPDVKAVNLQELIALAKQNPGKLNFGSSGNGSSIHLAGEMFRVMAGVSITHVPYNGLAPAINDLLGGQIQMVFSSMPTAMPHVKSGKLRAIGVTTAQRSRLEPGVPTLAEQGLPDFDVGSWYGVMAPAATPPQIVAQLHRDFIAALASPDTRNRMTAQGFEPVGNSPAEFAERIAKESRVWARIVKAANVKVD